MVHTHARIHTQTHSYTVIHTHTHTHLYTHLALGCVKSNLSKSLFGRHGAEDANTDDHYSHIHTRTLHACTLTHMQTHTFYTHTHTHTHIHVHADAHMEG